MELEKYSGLTMDFKNLMSCIQCHEDSTNISVILETLKTIVDICTNEECGKDAFREEGGLDFLIEFVSTTDSTILLEHSLKTLALIVDENVHSQMHMTKKEFFEILQFIIRRTSFPPSVLKNALLCSASVLFQNSLAQSLILESGFLQDLINIYGDFAPSHLNSTFTKPTVYDSSGDVWISVNSALCFAVNNPQNEENQMACSVLFPLSLKLLESSSEYMITSAVSSFLSLCIANNANNQKKFAEYDGLLVLKRCFQRHFDSMELDIKEFNSVMAKSNLHSINNFIGIISAVASENDKNAAFLGKLGVLTLMIKLLTIGVPDDQLQTRIILALACCIDVNAKCKSYVLHFADFHNFLRKNFEKGNAELISASKYLLQVCLNEEGSFPLSDTNILQDDNSVIFSSVSERGDLAFKHKMNTCDTGKNIRAKYLKRQKSCEQLLNFASDKKNSNETCDEAQMKNLFSNNCSEQLLERKNESFTPETFKLPDYEFYLSHKHLKAHEHHHKTKDRCFKSSSSKNEMKLPPESCYCSSIKSYTNSKHENILLLKDRKIKQKCKRKSFDCGEAFSSLNASRSLVDKENISENCGSCKKSFQLTNKHKTDYTTRKSAKKLKNNGSEKSSITNCSKVIRKFKPFVTEETAHLPLTSKKYDDFEKDFNPFSKPIIDELNKNMNSGSNKYDNSKCEFDLLPDIANSHRDILESNDRNFFSKLDDRSKYDISNDKINDYNSLNSCWNFHKNKISTLKNSGGLLDSSCTENIKEAEMKNSVNKPKKLRKSGKIKKSRNITSETLEKNKSQLDSDFDSYVQVIVFPGDSCEQHRLIANFEMLKVVSLKESSVV